MMAYRTPKASHVVDKDRVFRIRRSEVTTLEGAGQGSSWELASLEGYHHMSWACDEVSAALLRMPPFGLAASCSGR
jgi:hypothetical protein